MLVLQSAELDYQRSQSLLASELVSETMLQHSMGSCIDWWREVGTEWPEVAVGPLVNKRIPCGFRCCLGGVGLVGMDKNLLVWLHIL